VAGLAVMDFKIFVEVDRGDSKVASQEKKFTLQYRIVRDRNGITNLI